jgi:hypothetical protein
MIVLWGWDDVRIVGDILIGSLLASGVRLVVVKTILKPAGPMAAPGPDQ